MHAITVSPTIQLALLHPGGPAEIRDEQGRLLGYFAPASQPDAERYAQAAAHFDPKQLQQRKQSSRAGSTTQEVIERIQ
jgi:hypothetical protein